MWTKWLPWRLIISNLAKKHGFIDPIQLVASLNRMAQPAEVAAPVELLRLAAVLHARGLINSQVIQNNLDWIWPYWVHEQFDPNNRSFIPRAFSLTHINLTHRNWTAVGLPGRSEMPIVDPRGLVTPLYDGWSVDAWLVGRNGYKLFPAKTETASQKLEMMDNIAVVTGIEDENNFITSRVSAEDGTDGFGCKINVTARLEEEGYLVTSLRPFNPEGISFIHEVKKIPSGWEINGKDNVFFPKEPCKQIFSDYSGGDVATGVLRMARAEKTKCEVGLCTAAALFELKPGREEEIELTVPLNEDNKKRRSTHRVKWSDAVSCVPMLNVPDAKMKYLFDASVRTLILMSPEEILAGPYTYKEFWFRDAVFAANTMLALNMHEKVKNVIDGFLKYQLPSGYFKSQDGEWDSNGQVLWIMKRFCELSGEKPDKSWEKPIISAINWIKRKRTSVKKGGKYSGLFPAGFSAEHFGPNDYYYWDDFWGVAGLCAGEYLLKEFGREDLAGKSLKEKDSFLKCIDNSIGTAQKEQDISGIPSSPSRRMDSSAVGALVSSYPLKIYTPRDKNILDTARYLMDNDFLNGLLFHEIAHSGLNIYLSFAVAQVLLRSGEEGYLDIIEAASRAASETGQWPEAIHPWTGGGCMGDGQHLWASSEWIMIVRNCFVREEDNRLILCSGIPEKWLRAGEDISFGPAATSFGDVNIKMICSANELRLDIESNWRSEAPAIEVKMPGYEEVVLDPGVNSAKLKKAKQ